MVLEFQLKVRIYPEDEYLIEFLRDLAAHDGMVTRIEGDGDDLIELEIIEVSDVQEIE
jgi:hypothetical protein